MAASAHCQPMNPESARVTAKPSERQPSALLPRVLVFNFFAGIKRRGIPVYARELEECLQRVGARHLELRAPAWVARLPPVVQNVMFVLFEQLVAPGLARLRGCGLTVYPYNSGSVIDALLGRSVIVVHDLIPNRRGESGLAARYIRTCQSWHARCGRPIATVSRHTLRQLQRVRAFRRCDKFLWANPFYSFEKALQRFTRSGALVHDRDRPVVLLCSGTGKNKDFSGAVRLLMSLGERGDVSVRVLGFGDDAPLAARKVKALPLPWRDRITVLPRLGLDAIVNEFSACDLAWVHSRNEGFGRPVMEARLCGRPVVATDIGAFRQLRRFRHLHLYRDSEFETAFLAGLAESRGGACTFASAQGFNRQLETEVTRLLTSVESRRR
jgi:glycosyltransferase involved in cell wall biosynthesis